jgi:chromosome segregation ATPase
LQQKFNENRERMQEKIDFLDEELRTLKAAENEKSNLMKAKVEDYEKKIEKYFSDMNLFQKERDDARLKLVESEKRMIETNDKHAAALKRLEESTSAMISDLKKELAESLKLMETAKATEKDALERIEHMDSYLATLQSQVEGEKAKAKDAVYESQEVQAETQEQLLRVQKRLEETRRDAENYRKLADERDEQILDIKRQMRKQDKDMASSVAEDSGAVMKRLLEQKNKEIDKARQETRASLAQIVELEKKLELQERNIQEAKKEMKRRANSNKDEGMQEVDRLQIMLLDLKTSRVDLMERLDDSQHSNELLKREVASLTGQLAELKEVKPTA